MNVDLIISNFVNTFFCIDLPQFPIKANILDINSKVLTLIIFVIIKVYKYKACTILYDPHACYVSRVCFKRSISQGAFLLRPSRVPEKWA